MTQTRHSRKAYWIMQSLGRRIINQNRVSFVVITVFPRKFWVMFLPELVKILVHILKGTNHSRSTIRHVLQQLNGSKLDIFLNGAGHWQEQHTQQNNNLLFISPSKNSVILSTLLLKVTIKLNRL